MTGQPSTITIAAMIAPKTSSSPTVAANLRTFSTYGLVLSAAKHRSDLICEEVGHAGCRPRKVVCIPKLKAIKEAVKAARLYGKS